MPQAVVKIGNSQFLVQPGQEIIVDRLDSPEGKLSLTEVLLVIEGDNILVGQPTVPSASVAATILGQVRGPKIRSSVYKAKSRYRKTRGFRAHQTRIKIEEISAKSV